MDLYLLYILLRFFNKIIISTIITIITLEFLKGGILTATSENELPEEEEEEKFKRNFYAAVCD